MNQYTKINTVYKRDMTHPKKKILIGEFSCPEFEALKNTQWVWSEKVDGTNIRVIFAGGQIRVAGKADKSSVPPIVVKATEKFTNNYDSISEFLTRIGKEVCFYCEGFGGNIQNGKEYMPDGTVDLYLFDVNVDGRWLERSEVTMLAKELGFIDQHIVGHGTIEEAINFVKAGFKSKFGTADAEGLVLRPAKELLTTTGERVITKIKHKDFI